MRRDGSQEVLVASTFALVYLPIVLGILTPFLVFNQALNWDALGHFAAAQYIHDKLFPYWSGWNPQFFAGFPQGTFYPPLFHYLVALLGFIVPMRLAFNLIVAASILLTPASFYIFARSLKLDKLDSAFVMAAMTGLICAPLVFASNNNAIGGTFHSTFYVGLVANAWALPLAFFYFAALPKVELGRSRIQASMLLAMIVLSHQVTAIAAASYTLIYFLTCCRSWKTFKAFALHTIETILLTAFWVVPFLIYLPFTDTVHIRLSLGPASFALLVLGLLASFTLFVRPKPIEKMDVVLYFLLLTVGLLWLNFFPIRFHIYRLILFPVLAVPILFIFAIPKRFNWIVGLLGICGIVWGVATSYLFDTWGVKGPAEVEKFSMNVAPANRTLIVSSGLEQLTAHYNQIGLPLKFNFWAGKGLFVEASRNSRFILTLEKILDSDAMTWGVERPDNELVPSAQQKKLASKLLKSLGFNGVISTKEMPNLAAESRQLAFSYSKPITGLLLNENDRDNPDSYLRPWNEAQYFIVRGKELLLVESSLTFRRVTSYEVNIPEGQRFVLEGQDLTYFVKRLDRELLQIEFVLPNNRVERSKIDEISSIRNELATTIADEVELRKIDMLLDRLEDSLSQESARIAQIKFQDAPHFKLIVKNQVTLPEYSSVLKTVPHKFYFDYYKLPESQLVEVVNKESLIPVSDDKWLHSIGWWALDSVNEVTLFRSEAPFEFNERTLDTKISDIEVSPSGDSIEFSVGGNTPVPIVVRSSYFPKWRAWADGKPIEVFEASPSVMLVNAKGRVIMRYQTTLLEYLLSAIALLTFLTMGFRLVRFSTA